LRWSIAVCSFARGLPGSDFSWRRYGDDEHSDALHREQQASPISMACARRIVFRELMRRLVLPRV